METKKRITFVVNPISGTHGKEFILRLIEKELNHSIYDYSIRKTEYAGHASEIAAHAAAEHTDIVVAIGGDGTINEIGRALIHTNTAMGIIPCGSGNGLARHLHIPMEPKGAINVLNAGNIKTIDYGIIDNHPFFCTCGVGFRKKRSADLPGKYPARKPDVSAGDVRNRKLYGYRTLQSIPDSLCQCIAIWQQCLHRPTSLSDRRHDGHHGAGAVYRAGCAFSFIPVVQPDT